MPEGTELGVEYISILPDLSQFAGKVTRGATEASTRAAKSFAGKFNSQMSAAVTKGAAEAGRDAGEAMARAAQAAAKSEVSKLSKTLAAATDKQADAVGKLRVAEAKLEDVRRNGKATAGQVAAAEEAVAAAKRRATVASDNQKAAVERLTKAQTKEKEAAEAVGRAQQGSATQSGKAGGSAGSRFSEAFKGAFNPAKGLSQKLGKVDGKREGRSVATRFGVGFNGAIGSIVSKSAGVFAAGFAAVSAGGFLKDAVLQASDLGETMSKSATVFGDAQPLIDKFASTAAESLGQSKQQAVGAASSFGNLFTQLGIGQKPAAQMSTQMVQLASDFASFHNADITEVLEAQQAAFRGEYDSIQKYVPTINAAAVEQEALRLKLGNSTKELTAQDKALATQSLLMSGAGKAAGDFSRTSGGLANQQRILSARFADFKTSLGQVALPLVTKFITFLNDRGMPVLNEIKGGIVAFGAAWKANDGDVTSSGFPGFMERVAFAARQAFDYFKTDVLPRLRELGTYLLTTLIPVLREWASDTLTKLKGVLDKVKQAIADNRPQLEQLAAGIQNVAKFLIEKLIPFLGKVSNEALPILGSAIGTAITVISRLVDWFNTLKDTTGSVVRFVWEKVSGFFGDLLEGAAKAFSWVPGLGGKLKTAATEFGKFRDSVNEKLGGITDQSINLEIKYSNTGVNVTTPSSVGRRAAGGKITGPGGPTDDRAGMYLLSDQEWVIRASSSRKYGDAAMASINAGTATVLPGFATGGRPGLDPKLVADSSGLARSVRGVVVAAATSAARALAKAGGGLAGTMAFGRSQAGKPYVWGASGPSGYDCSGFVSALVNVAKGRAPYRRLGATGSMPWADMAPGAGRFSIGWFKGNPGHTAATINGTNFESRGGRGVVVGSGARGAFDRLFTHVGHVRGFAQGGKVGDAPYDLFNPHGKAYIGQQVVVPKALSFDNGGFLPTGVSTVINGTGKPEPLARVGDDGKLELSDRTLQRLANVLSGIAINLDGRRLDDWMSRRAVQSGW